MESESAIGYTGPAEVRAAPRGAARGFAAAWPYLLVAAVGFFILLPKLGDFGFWDPWEPKYGETVREMLARDSFWVPYYRDDVRLAKPILVYWGIMAGAVVFGLNEFGARIVGVLCAVGSMLGVYYAVGALRGRRAGLLSALVLASSPHFFLISRQAMPDVYLFTSVGMCLLFFCLGLYGAERRRDLHFAASYACFALAVLAKGPIVAGAIVFGAVALFALAHLDMESLCPQGRRLRSAVLVLGAAGLGCAAAALSAVAVLFAKTPAQRGGARWGPWWPCSPRCAPSPSCCARRTCARSSRPGGGRSYGRFCCSSRSSPSSPDRGTR